MPDSTIKLGIVGLGGWGRNLVRCFQETAGCTVVGLCDLDEGALSRQLRRCPGARGTTSYDELLGLPGLDAIAIATPTPEHAPMAAAALEAGHHLFVEKPLAMDATTAGELVELAAQRQRRLMVGHLLLYHPAVRYLKQLLQQGELGTMRYLHSRRVNLGVVRARESALWSLAPHDVSVALHLAGSLPETVACRGGSWLQPELCDVAFLSLAFPDGVLAQIHVSWLDPHKERRLTVVGSERMASFDDMVPAEKVRIFDKAARVEAGGVDSMGAISVQHGDIRIPRLSHQEPLRAETEHFVACLNGGRSPLSDGREGLAVVQVLEAAEHSLARGGQPVRLSQ